MVEHLDEWDSAAGTLPAVAELVSQMLPDIARLGALVLRGRAVEAECVWAVSMQRDDSGAGVSP